MILPTCREVAWRLASGEYDESSTLRRLLVGAHLAVCASCRRFKAQLALIGDAARLLAAGRSPGAQELAGVKDRVRARLAG